MKAAITSTNTRLQSMERDLDALELRMTAIRRSVESTEADFPRGIPSLIYPGYSSQVDEYNRLLRQYRLDFADYETQFAQNDSAIDQYNALLATCR